MTTARDFLPRPDRQFLGWLAVVVHYLKDKFGAWHIPEDEQQRIEQLLANFAAAFGLVDNPQTHTPAATTAKQEARKAAESGIRRLLKAYVTYNPLVTDKDRRAMELPIHKTTRTRVSVPTTMPFFEIDSSVIRRLIIHFFDQNARKAKPAGVHGAEIRWAILHVPVTHLKDLVNSSFDTHTPFMLEFDEDERGKTVYFCLCWENTRGEKGPWSEIVSAVIP
ncbi:MAG: hypothetical protein LBT48_04500 [Prevotellaceae bacterium]|jgi:hypothetical protein|nr:hypothetical protein [Prevotellaceae bacterium]